MRAAASPAGARGEPVAAAPPAEGVVGGVECARRLGVRDRLAWCHCHGTQQPFLLALTPYFFHSTLAVHTSRDGITEQQNSLAQISRKYRLDLWAGSARRDGASAAAAPADTRDEPTSLAPPVEMVVGMRNALSDFGFETK